MSATVSPITAPPRSERDELRQTLQRAIAARRAAEAAAGERRGAISRARQLASDAAAEVEKKRAGVEAARQRHAKDLAERLAGGAATPSIAGATRAARGELAEAEDAEEAAAAARQQLETGLADLEEDIRRAENDIGVALNALLAPVAAAALAGARSARDAFLRNQQVLVAILQHDAPAPKFSDPAEAARRAAERSALLADLKSEAVDILKMAFDCSDLELATCAQVQRAWTAAREALRADPDVPLPGSDHGR